MYYHCRPHQKKFAVLQEALKANGHVLNSSKAEVAFFDSDYNPSNLPAVENMITSYARRGVTVFTYPHGATGEWWYDGFSKPNPDVFASLVIGEGHRQVMKIVAPERRTVKIGWYYSPTRPFRPVSEVRRILFAPVHPSANRLLREEMKVLNAKVFESLLRSRGRRQIVVRHVGSILDAGLWDDPKVLYKAARADNTFQEIDQSDVIIGEGTFMYISAARGKPTIGLGTTIPIKPNRTLPRLAESKFDSYKHLTKFPIDFDDGDLEDLIRRACVEEPVEWKRNFIGDQLEPKQFCQTVADLRAQYLAFSEEPYAN